MPSRGPRIPGERSQTIRQAILNVLEEGPATARDLSSRVGISEKEVPHHLDHLQRSLRKVPRRLLVEPAQCMACAYVFEHRTRLTKPSSCPRCRSQRIAPPSFRLEAPLAAGST